MESNHCDAETELAGHAPDLTVKACLEDVGYTRILDVSLLAMEEPISAAPLHEADARQKLLLQGLQLAIPAQPPPKITIQPEFFHTGMLRL